MSLSWITVPVLIRGLGGEKVAVGIDLEAEILRILRLLELFNKTISVFAVV